ncbi:Polysaccharide deacetylase [Planctomycetes bacterium Poly30]|uniref:Polysaccharide deacetylase n=2 Tax=Saltatorellus ferox TaxID=2528018 RepID=A0A518EP17_9BACT|nr:Polysaccharide deacetylase [Planctomycetes bacterium Poly30]
MYHRVATPPCDPWDIAVSPENFAAHLEVLASLPRVISIGELGDSLRRGHVERSVTLTFDDGYLDNLECAEPLLARHGLPATVFVTTGGLRTGGDTMWWDVVGKALLHQQSLPPSLELGRGESARTWVMPEPCHEDLARWRAEPYGRREKKRPVPDRGRVYLDVYAHLAECEARDRELQIEQLGAWADSVGVETRPGRDERTMTADEVRTLAGRDGMTIGSHTQSHPFLSRVDAGRRREELAGSKRELQEVTGEEVVDFSYPNGDVPTTGAEEVARAGFATACTSRGAAAFPGQSPLAIPRLIVRDWEQERFARWLWQWGHG